MKNKKAVFAVAGVVAVAAAVVVMIFGCRIPGKEVKRHQEKMDALTINSTGKNDGFSNITGVSLNNDKKTATITVSGRANQKYPLKTRSYTVSSGIFDELEAVYYAGRTEDMLKNRDKEQKTYDAADNDLTFTFGSETVVITHSKIRESNLGTINKFLNIISEYSENKKSGLSLSENSVTGENEKAPIALYDLEDGYLDAGIRNLSGEKINCNTGFKLYAVNKDGTAELVPSDEPDFAGFSIEAGEEVPLQFDLNGFELTSGGKYKIVCSGFSAVFEIV